MSSRTDPEGGNDRRELVVADRVVEYRVIEGTHHPASADSHSTRHKTRAREQSRRIPSRRGYKGGGEYP